MTSSPSTAEFYRQEAARLRSMATSPIFYEVRYGLLSMAEEYDRMADQREELDHHVFGQPFARRAAEDVHGCVDGRQSTAQDRQRTS